MFGHILLLLLKYKRKIQQGHYQKKWGQANSDGQFKKKWGQANSDGQFNIHVISISVVVFDGN